MDQDSPIVVGLDGTPASNAAARWAARLAGATDGKVLAVHVVSRTWLWEMAAVQIDTDPILRRRRRELAGPWTEVFRRAGVPVATRIVVGEPTTEIRVAADEADASVIVVGGTRHSAVHDVFAQGTTQRLARECRRPLVVVPADWEASERTTRAS